MTGRLLRRTLVPFHGADFRSLDYGWLDADGVLRLAVARHPFRHARLPRSEAELWQHAFAEILTADVCTGEVPVTVIYNPRTRRHFVFEALRHKQCVFGM